MATDFQDHVTPKEAILLLETTRLYKIKAEILRWITPVRAESKDISVIGRIKGTRKKEISPGLVRCRDRRWALIQLNCEREYEE